MRAVVDLQARKVEKEPLKETYSERRVRIDEKKAVQAVKCTKKAAKKAIKGKKQHSIKGWITPLLRVEQTKLKDSSIKLSYDQYK